MDNENLIHREEHTEYNKYGDPEDIDVIYTKVPGELIRDNEVELAYLEADHRSNYQEIRDIEETIEYFKSKDIFNDLTNIENKAEKLINKEFDLAPQISFLYTKLSKFNKLTEEGKNKYLTRYCKLILEEENDFTNSLNNYNILSTLNRKLDINSKASELEVSFSLWKEIEADLLAVYDAELYLQLEELYAELNTFKVYINRKDTLDKAKKIIVEQLEPIIVNNKDHLKHILLKTNKLFKSI